MSTLIVAEGPWATLDLPGDPKAPRTAESLKDAGLRHDFALIVDEGRITAAGPRRDLEATDSHDAVVDLGKGIIAPGFVDPHTHPVFAATREDEFEMRNLGRSYEEIAKAGGGIRNSARRLRGISQEQMEKDLRDRCDAFLLFGTTTIEAKSGYGLSTESELASLRAIKAVSASHPLDLIPTFLGAHEIPDEYRDDREAYIALLLDDMLPKVAEEGLAEACDVFCEEHVFTVDESRKILQRAKDLGLAVKLHADEIRPTGGAELAAEMGALSADHLVAISDEGIAAMREAGVIPILLPGTSLYLNLENDAPGKLMMDAGLAPALATDFNPGSCPTRNFSLIMSLAAIKYGMTAAQVVGASTHNAACALGHGGEFGVLRPGALADLVVLDLPNLESLPYRLGENPVRSVMKRGEIVVRDRAIVRNT